MKNREELKEQDSGTNQKTAALLRANEELATLNRLARKVASQESLQEACDAVVSEVAYALKLDVAVLFLHEGEVLQLRAIETSYLKPETVPLHRVGECLCGLAAQTGQIVASGNIHTDKRCTWKECKEAGLHSFAAIPLVLGKLHVGVLGIASADHRDFKRAARFLRTAADQLAIYIQAARLLEQTRDHASQLELQITERKRAEEVLLKEKAFSDTVINSLPGIFYLLSENGRFLRWNTNFETISGYSYDEIEKMTVFDFYSGEEKERVAQAIWEVFAKGESHVEAKWISKDGRINPYYFTGIRFISDGRPYLMGMGIDISERKKAEDELKKREKELQRRVIELEEFYDMAVGRELRMKELKEEGEKLKKEIESLRNALSKYKKQ